MLFLTNTSFCRRIVCVGASNGENIWLCTVFCVIFKVKVYALERAIYIYSRTPLFRSPKGNEKKVRNSGASK